MRSGPGSPRRSTARRSPGARAALREALTREGAARVTRRRWRSTRRTASLDWTRASSRSPSGWPASRRSSPTWPTTRAGSRRTSTTTRARSPSSTRDSAIIHGLLRRYGDDEAAVIEHGERAAVEVERCAGSTRNGRAARAEDARLLAEVARAAAALSAARRDGGPGLDDGRRPRCSRSWDSRRASSRSPSAVELASDGEAAVEIDGDALAFDASGIDQVVYRLAPNPGEPARPLAKIASGGELSRVALAIKRVLAEADATPTLVFDEVDTGIGGRSADPIGRSLWGLARRHQVLCVTHLPQIAAHADAHFRIAKRERDGRTVTEVERLDREGRIVELAAMLGGGPGDAAALASARELLDRAEAWRPAAASAAGRVTAPRRTSTGRSRTTWPTCASSAASPPRRSAPIAATSRDFARERAAARRRPGRVARTRPSGYLAARTRRGRRGEPASPRRACGAGPRRSRASTGSPSARG